LFDGKFNSVSVYHLVAETCSCSLTATYIVNRPVKLMRERAIEIVNHTH